MDFPLMPQTTGNEPPKIQKTSKSKNFKEIWDNDNDVDSVDERWWKGSNKELFLNSTRIRDREVTTVSSNSHSCMTKKQCALYTISSIVLVASSVFAALEFKSRANIKIISACLGLNGASAAPFFDLVVTRFPFICEELMEKHFNLEWQAPDEPTRRKKIIKIREDHYKWISGWSYPLLYLTIEGFLEFFPEKNIPGKTKQLALTAFTWFLGFHLGKDLLHHISKIEEEFAYESPPLPRLSDRGTTWCCKENQQDHPTCGFRTRDNSHIRKICWGFYIATIVASQIFYRIFYMKKNHTVDQIGVDLIIDGLDLCSGQILGEISAAVMDNWKESIERAWYDRYKESGRNERAPISLHALKIANKIFSIVSSPLTGIVLALPVSSPQSLDNDLIMGATGLLWGSRQFLSRREFEVYDYTSKQKTKREQKTTFCCTLKKMKQYATKRIFLILGILGFIAILLLRGITESPGSIRSWGNIAAMFCSVGIGFAITEILAQKFYPGKSHCFTNELAFHFLYSPTSFSIFYQYFSQIADIHKEEFDGDSEILFGLEFMAFVLCGLAVGNNFGTLAHKRWTLATTHPLTTQELGNIATGGTAWQFQIK